MRIKGFLQAPGGEWSTVARLLQMHEQVETVSFLGCYAYATQSGTAKFEIEFSAEFWDNVETRWLFGIDYGRTQPKALEFIRGRPNAQVRVYDGAWVVDQPGFVPRRDYHMKAAFLLHADNHKYGMVAGSGNFSASGLSKNIECGIALYSENVAEYGRTFRNAHLASEALWADATPLDDILEEYTEAWATQITPVLAPPEELPDFDLVDAFWIEAGYVTQNRGPGKPGNQIDMPRGMNRFFGFHAADDLPVNSVIGAIDFITPNEGEVSRNLRLGNNHMEKITLPIPEDFGFDVYDGKVLVFREEGAKHRLWALEEADFEAAFGGRLAGVKLMNSGRRYGYII